MKIYRSEKLKHVIWDTYDQLLGQWGVETEERDIPTTYGITHVIVCGEASLPPLVLFHGVGDDSALMWLYNAKALSEHFRLYAVDTLGGPGKSVPNKSYCRGFDDVRWIDEILARLGLAAVNIAGVSNGAYLTQLYGLHRPARVRRMACISGTVPVGERSPMKTMMKIFLPEALLPTRRNTVKLLKKMSGSHSGVFTGNPLILTHYRALLRGFRPMAMRWHAIARFSREDADAIRGKTLYLIGEDDPFARLGGKAALLDCHMNAKFYPEAGHGLNHELAGEINRDLLAYLQMDG